MAEPSLARIAFIVCVLIGVCLTAGYIAGRAIWRALGLT